jgi:AraC family transcriptional regulator, transcriptional activator FtrA
MVAHRVIALVHPPLSLFGLGLVAEVFSVSQFGGADGPAYRVGACTVAPGWLPTDFGLVDVAVNQGLSALRLADTVVIPDWSVSDQVSVPAAVLDGVRTAHARGARILTVGTGAFVPAAAGLLSGRRAVTHWKFAADLAARYPDVQVVTSVRYIDHGDVATSAGLAAGIDLCLQVVRADHGLSSAAEVARNMTISQPGDDPSGWSSREVPARVEPTLVPVLDWAINNLGEQLTVAILAQKARMSQRTFVRRFTKEVGESPGKWILSRRINAAKELLAHTDLPVEAVAKRVGLSSAVNLRRHFHRLVGMTPAIYRRSVQACTTWTPFHAHLSNDLTRPRG